MIFCNRLLMIFCNVKSPTVSGFKTKEILFTVFVGCIHCDLRCVHACQRTSHLGYVKAMLLAVRFFYPTLKGWLANNYVDIMYIVIHSDSSQRRWSSG